MRKNKTKNHKSNREKERKKERKKERNEHIYICMKRKEIKERKQLIEKDEEKNNNEIKHVQQAVQ